MTRHVALAAVPLALLTACGVTSQDGAKRQNARRLAAVAAPSLAPLGAAVKEPGLGSMTVTTVRCGLATVRHGAPTNLDGTAGAARAAAGQQICAVTARFTNTEGAAVTPAPLSSLTTSDGQSHAEDPLIARMVSLYAPTHPWTSAMNRSVQPGQSVEYQAYFQIPRAARATSLSWPGTAPIPAGTFIVN